MSALATAARTAVNQCMALESGERCTIVTDDDRRSIGEVLYRVAAEVTTAATILQYPPLDQHGMEPSAPVAAAMRESDVVLAPTSKSLSHTRARSRASDAGARIATLPAITEDVFVTGLDADYDAIRETCDRLYHQVAEAETIRVTTERGTDLTVEPGSRAWRKDTGIVHEPGAFSNLPAGEVFVSPTTADGTYVVDGTIRPHGLLDPDDAVTIEVTDGYVTAISDEAVRSEVEAAAEAVGRDAYNLAELGIGTNLAVTSLVGSVLLDEKAAGTVHVAIGDDAGIGGDTDAPLHMDGVIRDPTVSVDGEELALPGL